ncbi:MAG TPA: Gfo/Idh/MocA family oxidoreductase [Candidatus Hydrogenedentes bacterium]|nr:Gfo/Idh/MocA family oxidoreductase [Candidatus Hydrogenedentota bacterium]HPG68305.1 Gfo/Idh/MocA family oxidoreductase [Candidatus Hydrogenedentota bacterium]
MRVHRKLSRRQFARRLTAAVGPLVLPSGVLAAPGRPGANDRIRTGHIGLGPRGLAHLDGFRDNVVALCDVDANRLEQARHRLGHRIACVADYRELLQNRNVDAVVIATPDHWHALQTIHACQAGKDVYVEQPACRTVAEGLAMAAAVRRYGRVAQVGSQDASSDAVQTAIREIAITGPACRRVVCCCREGNPVGGDPSHSGEPPAALDWDLWLGPLRWHPYNPDYGHYRFRWMLGMGGGRLCHEGAHALSAAILCLGRVAVAGRVTVTAKGEAPAEGLYDAPTALDVKYAFETSGVSIVWQQPSSLENAETRVSFERNGKTSALERNEAGWLADENRAADDRHRMDWLEAVRDRRDPAMPIETGVMVARLCALGNLAYRIDRPLEWDPAKSAVVNDEEANRLLDEPARGPWQIWR